jgi:hypothetical protein
MHEWNYEKEPDYYLLRYLHETWDTESTGFTIECRAADKITLRSIMISWTTITSKLSGQDNGSRKSKSALSTDN